MKRKKRKRQIKKRKKKEKNNPIINYMISYLDKHLPIELTNKIYKIVHESYMKEIIEIIKFKIVYTLYWEDRDKNINNSKISFLVSEKQNYYKCLEN